MTCVCDWLRAGLEVLGESVTGLGLGFTKFWRSMGKVGHVSGFWFR